MHFVSSNQGLAVTFHWFINNFIIPVYEPNLIVGQLGAMIISHDDGVV